MHRKLNAMSWEAESWCIESRRESRIYQSWRLKLQKQKEVHQNLTTSSIKAQDWFVQPSSQPTVCGIEFSRLFHSALKATSSRVEDYLIKTWRLLRHKTKITLYCLTWVHEKLKISSRNAKEWIMKNNRRLIISRPLHYRLVDHQEQLNAYDLKAVGAISPHEARQRAGSFLNMLVDAMAVCRQGVTLTP